MARPRRRFGGGGRGGRRGPGRRRRNPDDDRNKESQDRKEQAVEIEGSIVQVLAGTMFKVEITGGHIVLAHISGKMRKRFIRLVVGDRVKMEMSPYDKDKARIVYRLK